MHTFVSMIFFRCSIVLHRCCYFVVSKNIMFLTISFCKLVFRTSGLSLMFRYISTTKINLKVFRALRPCRYTTATCSQSAFETERFCLLLLIISSCSSCDDASNLYDFIYLVICEAGAGFTMLISSIYSMSV